MKVDINADVGESFGLYRMGNDEEFMQYITSANVACGFHAGDATVMHRTVLLAKKYGVQIGAHPGLPDRQGFGRREMNCSIEEIYDDVMYQVGALKAFVEASGMRLHHVKPHGSLYGMANRRAEVAEAICQVILDVDPKMYFYTMKKGLVGQVARKMGVRVVFELYGDLEYDPEGNLVITRHHEAQKPNAVAAKVLKMVQHGRVTATDGSEIAIEGSSVCLHSDTPDAVEILRAVNQGLREAGFLLESPPL
ncbi:MAG: 5-oxoprolinase subunit PxpA [Desulfosoma sp.]